MPSVSLTSVTALIVSSIDFRLESSDLSLFRSGTRFPMSYVFALRFTVTRIKDFYLRKTDDSQRVYKTSRSLRSAVGALGGKKAAAWKHTTCLATGYDYRKYQNRSLPITVYSTKVRYFTTLHYRFCFKPPLSVLISFEHRANKTNQGP